MQFETLLYKISPVLKRIAYRLNRRFTYYNHEDLYQEAVIHLWQGYRENKLSDKTDSYILQGCYFHLKNYMRKANVRNNQVSLEGAFCSGEEGTALEEKLAFKRNVYREDIEKLDNKLLVEVIMNNGFTSREKEILKFYAEGLNTRQIGSNLGISHVMVVKLTHKLRQKCKKYIDA